MTPTAQSLQSVRYRLDDRIHACDLRHEQTFTSQSHTQTRSPRLTNRAVATLSAWVKRTRREAFHSLLFSTQTKNVRSYTSIRRSGVHSGCQEVNSPRQWTTGFDHLFAPTDLTQKKENPVNMGTSPRGYWGDTTKISHLTETGKRAT